MQLFLHSPTRLKSESLPPFIFTATVQIGRHFLFTSKCSNLHTFNEVLLSNPRGRDSSVGIVTGYGLEDPGIKPRWGATFSAPVQTGPGGPPSLLYNGYLVFPGGKAAGAWR